MVSHEYNLLHPYTLIKLTSDSKVNFHLVLQATRKITKLILLDVPSCLTQGKHYAFTFGKW